MPPTADSLPNHRLQRELQTALVATALRFGNALRQFETRRRRCGYDYSCSRLLDEVSLCRSLLLALADEVGRAGSGARTRH
jgi:hypothetical protein